jgi:polyribonucleotide nucleotidyltransferase
MDWRRTLRLSTLTRTLQKRLSLRGATARLAACSTAGPLSSVSLDAEAWAKHIQHQTGVAVRCGFGLDFETGRLARLATGSVTVHAGSTQVLVACVLAAHRAPASFAQLDALLQQQHTAGRLSEWQRTQELLQTLHTAPLWVDVRERASARGLIPTSYHRRESAATEKEVITARLIDRALRPTLPRGYCIETQLTAEVLSADGQLDPDTLALNGAAIALLLAFQRCFPQQVMQAQTRPRLVAAVRIARLAQTSTAADTVAFPPSESASMTPARPRWIIQPSYAERLASDLDLVFAGTSDGCCVALEGEAKAVPPEDIAEACRLASAALEPLRQQQEALLQQCRLAASMPGAGAGPPALFWAMPRPQVVAEALRHSGERLVSIYAHAPEKTERGIAVAQESAQAVAHLRQHAASLRSAPATDASSVSPGVDAVGPAEAALAVLEASREAWRQALQRHQHRVDGRLPREMRPMEARVQVLPSDTCHGSALVSRGETQVLAVATLGFPSLAKRLDAYGGGADTKQFYVHYQFPPYCNNQLGRGDALYRRRRREVGHGILAERAVRSVLPSDLWHAVRLEADVLASAGSSSMAAAAAGSLALMDAGLPLAGPVAGVSIGGILATTSAGSSATTEAYLRSPFAQDAEPCADLFLVDILGLEDFFGDFDCKVAGTEQGIILPPQAPRRGSWNLSLADRGRLLGAGGQRVRELEQHTGCSIQLEDDGSISLWAPNAQVLEQALEILQQVTRIPACGDSFHGRVLQILDFGAVIEIQPSPSSFRLQGLLHRSAFASALEWTRVQVGDALVVRVTQVDPRTGSLRFAQVAPMDGNGVPNGTSTLDERRDAASSEMPRN